MFLLYTCWKNYKNQASDAFETHSKSVGTNHGHVDSFAGNTVLHGAKCPCGQFLVVLCVTLFVILSVM